MEHPKATPKDFFLWAGAMVALYGGVVAFIALLFGYLNRVFPDTALGYYDPYAGGVAYSMASLIVLAPVFLILMRVIRRSIERDPSRNEVWVRRWALFLTLFIAGATIVIDLIVLLYTFLSGEELGVRFLLKVLVVLLVAGAGFMHFLADIRGYWAKNPRYAAYVNYGVGALIILTVLAGFLIVGSPQAQRDMRLDARRAEDLQNIQWQIVNFWQQKQVLPRTLEEVADPISGFIVPVDPQTGAAYGYRQTGTLAFELCATFVTETPEPFVPYIKSIGEGTWAHGAGEVCFDRSIDPERYPPFTRGIQQ